MKAIVSLVAVVAFAGVALGNENDMRIYRQIIRENNIQQSRPQAQQPAPQTSEKGRLFFDYVDPIRDRGRVEVIVDLDRGTATVRFPDGGSASGLVRAR